MISKLGLITATLMIVAVNLGFDFQPPAVGPDKAIVDNYEEATLEAAHSGIERALRHLNRSFTPTIITGDVGVIYYRTDVTIEGDVARIVSVGKYQPDLMPTMYTVAVEEEHIWTR